MYCTLEVHHTLFVVSSVLLVSQCLMFCFLSDKNTPTIITNNQFKRGLRSSYDQLQETNDALFTAKLAKLSGWKRRQLGSQNSSQPIITKETFLQVFIFAINHRQLNYWIFTLIFNSYINIQLQKQQPLYRSDNDQIKSVFCSDDCCLDIGSSIKARCRFTMWNGKRILPIKSFASPKFYEAEVR